MPDNLGASVIINNHLRTIATMLHENLKRHKEACVIDYEKFAVSSKEVGRNPTQPLSLICLKV